MGSRNQFIKSGRLLSPEKPRLLGDRLHSSKSRGQDQRGTGGLKGFPLAKIFARTREDLVYDSERLMWLQVTGHLGTHTLGQISGLAETHDNMFNIVSHQGNVH